eukprot:357840-Chlamydomonas_euryale.AAC.4
MQIDLTLLENNGENLLSRSVAYAHGRAWPCKNCIHTISMALGMQLLLQHIEADLLIIVG